MPIRFAHLCDIHLAPGDRSEDGFRAALRRVNALDVDFVITGGDHIRDSMAADLASTEEQWSLYKRVLAEEFRGWIEPVIGNHDVWGWSRSASGCTGDEERFGKAMALHQLGLSATYRSFDVGRWRFILLDSIFPRGEMYCAQLDEEQYSWLHSELDASAGRHIVVISHIPVLSVTPFFFGHNEGRGEWDVPGAWMHLDARRLRDLFARYKVRLCLAGHMHQVDRVEMRGVTYMVNGSLSGGVWAGSFEGFSPGFAIMTLHDDGRFSRRFVTYRLPRKGRNKARSKL